MRYKKCRRTLAPRAVEVGGFEQSCCLEQQYKERHGLPAVATNSDGRKTLVVHGTPGFFKPQLHKRGKLVRNNIWTQKYIDINISIYI